MTIGGAAGFLYNVYLLVSPASVFRPVAGIIFAILYSLAFLGYGVAILRGKNTQPYKWALFILLIISIGVFISIYRALSGM